MCRDRRRPPAPLHACIHLPSQLWELVARAAVRNVGVTLPRRRAKSGKPFVLAVQMHAREGEPLAFSPADVAVHAPLSVTSAPTCTLRGQQLSAPTKPGKSWPRRASARVGKPVTVAPYCQVDVTLGASVTSAPQ